MYYRYYNRYYRLYRFLCGILATQNKIDVLEVTVMSSNEVNNKVREEFLMDVARAEYNMINSLVNIRKDENLTQGDVAEITGLTQQMISKIEKIGNNPTLENFLKYVVAIGLEIKFEKIKE